ncbi:unnamed protein product [Danaus chrysippus]|uniref:unspecific monooxygenase n=1 Tax=Danaus chrysippus TaxID=151541 RepID=A0A8J2QYP3_9NEOP|nr:unnamed protein product [Danaus chrysippus]
MILLIIGILIITLYFYGTRNFDYWKKRGVPYEEPLIFFGSNLKQFINGVSVSERFAALYRRFPGERFVGFFEGNNPATLIRDPELVKHILITDFKNFYYRGLNPNRQAIEPLLKNLFTSEGDVWKLLRQKLTPTFSSGKLKAMFPLIVERTEKLAKLAEGMAETCDELDIRDLMARYTTDFIGACGFGIDSAALNDENSDFRKLGKRIVNITKRDHFVSLLKRMMPVLCKDLHFMAPEIENKTVSIVKQIMEQRNYKPSGRNDFVDMMLELREKGKLVGDSLEHRNPDGSPKIVEIELDDQLIAAQVFIFFVAGFETSSSASSFLLHMLAYHPDVQEKCRKEVDEVLKNYGGKLSFDAVKDMKYLEMSLKESIRFLTSPGFLIRRTVNKCTLPGTNFTLDENMVMIVSTEAMNMDEELFENPEEFRPERFNPENVGDIKKCTFMPFGDGPRSCIGERLGIMQSLAGVATILSKFTLSPSRSSLRKPRIDPMSTIVQTVIGGLPLSLKRRKDI